MARRETVTRALGQLALATGAMVLLGALYLGFYIGGTPRAVARAAKGQQIAVPAAVAVIVAVVALAGRRRGWALPVGCVAAAAAVVAVLLTFLIPTPDTYP